MKTQNTFVRKRECFYMITQVAEPKSREEDGIDDINFCTQE